MAASVDTTLYRQRAGEPVTPAPAVGKKAIAFPGAFP
jgi:hypothetical protein